jgi:hypothetical protein
MMGSMNQEAEALVTAVEAALPGWVRRAVERLVVAWSGRAGPEVLARADEAGAAAVAEVVPQLRRLLSTDIDQQWTNPLSVVRAAVRHPTAVLREEGVPEVVRDPFDEASFPDDVYGLTPFNFAEVDPALQEVGIRWGAAKAREHLARHGAHGTLGGPPP